jgi:uncharacterized membrane protein
MATIDEQNKQHNENPYPSDSTESSGPQLRHPVSFSFLPHTLFLLLAIPFGILFTFLTPPFQVPDEPFHLFRAWQLAEGRVLSEIQNNVAGGYFPEGLVKVGASTDHLRWQSGEKVSVSQIISLFDVPLGQKKVFVPIRSAVYSPVPYLPQTLAILLAKPLQLRPLALMYWIRIVNLLAWVGLVYAAIRVTPVYKNLFMLLALTPMSLYQAASISADALTNGLALLILCLILCFCMNKDSVLSGRAISGFILSAILLSLCKNVYFLFVFLFLFIPVRRIGSIRRYLVLFGIAVFLALAAAACWSVIVSRLPVFWKPDVDPPSQIAFIKSQPLEYLRILSGAIWGQKWLMYKSFIGWFGWVDTLLGKWHTRLWMLLLAVFALSENRRDYQIGWMKKILCGLLFVFQTVFMYTLMYILWNKVGSDEIGGMQGRYFIPIMPLALLIFYNTRLRFPFKAPSLWAAGCVIGSLINSTWVIWNRFYSGW